MRRSTRLHRGLSAMLSTLVLGTFCLGFAPAASAEALPDFSYLGSFGSLSADDTQTAAVLIWQAFSSHLENIDLSAVTAKYTDCTEDCLGLYREIMHTAAPAVLHASNYYYSAWNGGLRIKIQYAVGADEYDALYRSSICTIISQRCTITITSGSAATPTVPIASCIPHSVCSETARRSVRDIPSSMRCS